METSLIVAVIGLTCSVTGAVIMPNTEYGSKWNSRGEILCKAGMILAVIALATLWH